MKSLRSRIIAHLLAVIFSSLFIVGGSGVISGVLAVKESTQAQMSLLCDSAVARTNSVLEQMENSVKILGNFTTDNLESTNKFYNDESYKNSFNNIIIKRFTDSIEYSEYALDFFIRYDIDKKDSKSDILIYKNSNNEILNGKPKDLSKRDSETEWYYKVRQTGKAMWFSNKYSNYSDIDGENFNCLTYVMPIYINDEFFAVIGIDVKLKEFSNIALNINVYNSGFCFITDDNGTVVFHKDISMGTNLAESNPGMKKLVSDIRNNDYEKTIIRMKYRNKDYETMYSILDNGMRIVVTVPTSEINSHISFILCVIFGVGILMTFLFLISASKMSKSITTPIIKLNNAAKEIANGELNVDISNIDSDTELGELAENLRKMTLTLKAKIEDIASIANHDALTGLKNKHAYADYVSDINKRIHYMKTQFGVVVMDLNFLKKINDTNGHKFGDDYLYRAGRLISSVFTKSDIYRIGGDEFVVILEKYDYEHRNDKFRELQISVQSSIEHPDSDFGLISLASGMAVYNAQQDNDYSDVFNRADNAMYINKTEMKKKYGNTIR